MDWLKKNWIIIVVIAVLAGVGYWFLKGKSTVLSSGSGIALGKTSKGADYYESDVQKEMKIIRGDADWYKTVKEKAKTTSSSVEDQLRANAIYMIENYH